MLPSELPLTTRPKGSHLGDAPAGPRLASRLELQPVGSVGDPDADGVDELARRDRRRMADHGDEVAMAARLHLQDGESAVLVVKGHALD